MKKSTGLVAGVVVVALAYSGASWYMGKQAQLAVEHLVANANEGFRSVAGDGSTDPVAQLRIDRFERGVFSSLADYTLTIPDASDSPIEVRIADRLHHGPFPWALLKSGDFAPALAASFARLIPTATTQAWVSSQPNGVSPLSIQTRVSLAGQAHTRFSFKPVDIKRDGEHIVFSGGLITVDWSNDFRDHKVHGAFETLSVAGETVEGELAFSEIALSHDSQTQSDGQVRVQGKLGVSKITASDESFDGDIVLDNSAVVYESTQKDTLLSATLRYDFGRIRLGDIDLGSIALGGRASNIDAIQMASLLKLLDAIDTRQTRDDSLDLLPAEQEALEKHFKAMVALKPVVAIDPVLWKTAKGESSALIDLHLAPAENQTEGRPVSPDELLVQSIRNLEIRLDLSRPMLVHLFTQFESDPAEREQLAAFANMMFDGYVKELEASGLVKVREDGASTRMVFSKGALSVNDQPMSIEELMGLVFQMVL